VSDGSGRTDAAAPGAPPPARRRERIARGAAPPDRTVWIDGELLRGAEARVCVFDRGVHDGGGIFETFRVHDGRPFLWERHLERMVLAAAELGFPVPPSPTTLREGLDATLAANGLTDAVARITVTRGIAGGRPTRTGCWIECEPVAGRLWRGTRTGEGAVITSKRAFAPGVLGAYKTTSRLAYHLAFEEAKALGADETILLTHQGEVLEGSMSNVFLYIDGQVATPSHNTGILPGIMRGFVLQACYELGYRLRTSAIWRDELSIADELFLTNAVQGVVTITSVNGRAVKTSGVADRVREALAQAIAAGA
jgi:branched-subunit amino acid aminotransferase/4-amino-4-deoxychorismate lyase